MAEPTVDRERRPTGERVSCSLFAAWHEARFSDFIATVTARPVLHANLGICAILAILEKRKPLFP
jgi:hypothetical protein